MPAASYLGWDRLGFACDGARLWGIRAWPLAARRLHFARERVHARSPPHGFHCNRNPFFQKCAAGLLASAIVCHARCPLSGCRWTAVGTIRTTLPGMRPWVRRWRRVAGTLCTPAPGPHTSATTRPTSPSVSASTGGRGCVGGCSHVVRFFKWGFSWMVTACIARSCAVARCMFAMGPAFLDLWFCCRQGNG